MSESAMAQYRRETERVVTIWDGTRAWTVPHGPVVYFIGTDTHISRLVKIGRTLDLQKRIDGLRNGSPVPLRLLACVRNYGGTEESLHSTFADVRAHGEWFDLGDDPMGTIQARVGDLERYAAARSLATIPLPPLNI